MTSSKIYCIVLIISLAMGCGKDAKENNIAVSRLVSIDVSPQNFILTTGTTWPLTATGTYSDKPRQDLTSSVTWTSSKPGVAQISQTGIVTSLATGTTTITALWDGISGSTVLTVNPESNNTVTMVGGSSYNVLPITVNGSLCSPNSYLNKPCVSVTVCSPGGSVCQTINDVLLDTGSTGFRIFKQVLNIPLAQIAAGSGSSLANCIHYGDGSAHWGPVRSASVILGNEPAVQMPIQVIDADFGPPPSACKNADAGPEASGFNAILGIGLFTEDCGPACAKSAANGMYYACSGTACAGTTAALSDQIQNPVALLPQDNNGIIVQLPQLPAGGAAAVDGQLILGIGTQANNEPFGVTAYPANYHGEFVTIFEGKTYSDSFIDSGSNGIFFVPPSTKPITTCAPPNESWFCPSYTMNLTAATIGTGGSPSKTVSFQIGHLVDLTNSSNNVFSEIGAVSPGIFDWGLPFYFGRNVYVGIEGKASSLGVGPYWAY